MGSGAVERANPTFGQHAARCGAAALGLAAGLAIAAWIGASAQQEARLADELVALTNVDRTSNGLPALSVDRRLLPMAQERSQDMLARGYFSHSIPPDGHMVFDDMRKQGIDFRAAGENLEQNTAARAQSVRYAQHDFMNSPSHRALILSPDMDHVGAGAALGRDRAVYTVLFLGLGQVGPNTRPAPMLGGADAPESAARGPAPTAGVPRIDRESATTAPRLAVPPSETPLGRLRQTSARPLGLIEELVNRTLRLYLGL